MRVSVTDLDQFRYWRADEEMTLDDLRQRLLHRDPPSEAMLAGTALHHALEHASEHTAHTLSALGYTFTFDIEAAIALPVVRELKAVKEYDLDGRKVRVVGKVDGLHGKRVEDHKTTSSTFDAEKYLNTWQWRFYLDIFEADTFRWNVFQMRAGEPQEYVVTNLHPLETCRYPALQADCERHLRDFLDLVDGHIPEYAAQQAAKEAA